MSIMECFESTDNLYGCISHGLDMLDKAQECYNAVSHVSSEAISQSSDFDLISQGIFILKLAQCFFANQKSSSHY